MWENKAGGIARDREHHRERRGRPCSQSGSGPPALEISRTSVPAFSVCHLTLLQALKTKPILGFVLILRTDSAAVFRVLASKKNTERIQIQIMRESGVLRGALESPGLHQWHAGHFISSHPCTPQAATSSAHR